MAGNASGVNDGACALVIASEGAAARHGNLLELRARGEVSVTRLHSVWMGRPVVLASLPERRYEAP